MFDRPTGSRGRFCFIAKGIAAFALMAWPLANCYAAVGGAGPDIIPSFQQNLGGGSSGTVQPPPNALNTATFPPIILFDPSNTYLPVSPSTTTLSLQATATAGSNVLTNVLSSTGTPIPAVTAGITSGFSTVTGSGIAAGSVVNTFSVNVGPPVTLNSLTLNLPATASGTVTLTAAVQGTQQYLYQALWNWGDPSTVNPGPPAAPFDPTMTVNPPGVATPSGIPIVNSAVAQAVPPGGPTTDYAAVLSTISHTFINNLPGGPAEFNTTPVNVTPPQSNPLAFYPGVTLTIQQWILTNITVSATATSGSNILTGFTSTTGISVGAIVTGPGIPANTIVGSVTPTTVLLIQGPPPPPTPTVPSNATTTGTGPLLFTMLQKGANAFIASQVRLNNANLAPTALLDNIGSPATGIVPYTLTVTPSRSFDQDGFITWAAIDWGDGFTQNLSNFFGDNSTGITGTLTAGSNTITNATNTQGLIPGFNVAGPGIPAGTQVIGVTSSTITLSNAATASSTGAGSLISFSYPSITAVPIAFFPVGSQPAIPTAFINYMPNTPAIPYTHKYTTPGIFKVTLSIIDNGRVSPSAFSNGVSVGGTLNTFPNPPSSDPAAALQQIRAFAELATGYGTESNPQTQFEPQLSQDFLTVQIPGNLVTTQSAKFSLDLSKKNNDSVQFQFLPNTFPNSVANAQVSITLGTGATALVVPTFTTDKKGRFSSSTLTFVFDGKRKVLKLTLHKSALRAAFAQTVNSTTQAITPNPAIANGATVANGSSDVPVTIIVNGTTVVSTIVRFQYTAQAGKKGTGKNGHTLNPGN
jgi:hypothetical protein